MIVIRAIRYLDNVVDIGIPVARSWVLGRPHLFRVRATTVHDAAHTSAFEFGLARRAIVGPVHAQVGPSINLGECSGSKAPWRTGQRPILLLLRSHRYRRTVWNMSAVLL